MSTNYLIIPGLGNSGEQHWQTYFEESLPNSTRVKQAEWDSPECNDWVAEINAAASRFDPSTVIMIGHSLGCAAIAHWASTSAKQIKGAMLVAPSDTESVGYDFPATGFAPLPATKISFPTIIVASLNDPWVSMDRAKLFASNWGSQLVDIGEAGHINAASGHYKWNEGLEILSRL